ncbi:MAG: RagB/SusD family nutrient uptake outer membrane protein [Bacteroidales bacterium]|nr:RagB/SusD family nutrient uptake outer membrane protein [Bacteroidales bacterium]
MRISIKSIICALALLLSLSGCRSFFEPQLDNKLDSEDSYTDRSNIYAAFMGLFSLLQEAGPHLVVASELQGDLITPTPKAPDDYWDVYRYTVRDGNPVADASPLYKIVMNCNDFLRNTVAYNHKYPGVLTEANYKQMIAGAINLRAWAYLNIGKLYGKAVYYDYALTQEHALEKARTLSLDELVKELIFFVNTGVDGINGLRRSEITNILGTAGIWNNVVINPDALMTELYLWNKDYESAAKRGINMISGQAATEAGNNHKYTLSPQFGAGAGALKKWHTLFTEDPVAVHVSEGISLVIYDNNLRQENPLYTLFSNDTRCKFYLEPTAIMVSKFIGPDYKKGVSTIQDPRGPEVSYATVDGDRIMYKYLKERTLQDQDAPIYLYRAADVHMMVAEALNALGNYDAAEAILNVGFQPYWVAGNRYADPFSAPIYAYEKLKLGRGVRGRLNLPALYSTDARFMPSDLVPGTETYSARRKAVVDSLIIEETAREFAGEGRRWFTMMRIARNSGHPEIVSRFISRKFPEAERTKYYATMLDEKNWFINCDL